MNANCPETLLPIRAEVLLLKAALLTTMPAVQSRWWDFHSPQAVGGGNEGTLLTMRELRGAEQGALCHVLPPLWARLWRSLSTGKSVGSY